MRAGLRPTDRQAISMRAEGLDACYEGRPSHPITQALAHSLERFAIPRARSWP